MEMNKVLRPWVKVSAATVLIGTAYLIVTSFVIKPKPHTVQFDLKRI